MTDLLDTTDQQQPEQAQEQANQTTDLLGGEQTPDEKEIMQKRINDSQAFIEQLKAEKRQQEEQFKALQEKVQKLEGAIPSLDQAVQQATKKPSTQATQTETLDVESVTNSVLEQLKKQQEAEKAEAERKQQQSAAEATYQETTQRIIEVYGDKAKDVMSQKLQENGISVEKARVMMSDPEMSKLLLRTLDASPAKSSTQPTGGLNTAIIGKPKEQEVSLLKMTSAQRAAYIQEQRDKLKGN